MGGTLNDRIAEEARFHDLVAELAGSDIPDVDIYFKGATCPENRFIVDQLGDVKGRRILDLGCGTGESSVYFARRGAECVAGDISPAMVARTVNLARAYGVKVEGRLINAMAIDFPENSFDVVYAANLLHHVEPRSGLREMWRVVRPGGKVCFWDPLRHNPVINIYRRIATEVRTADEAPLDIGIIRFARQLFSTLSYDTFWIASLWIFIQFFLIEGVRPNEERYWKKIVYEEERLRSCYRALERVDKVLKKIPYMRRFAWNIAVVATK